MKNLAESPSRFYVLDAVTDDVSTRLGALERKFRLLGKYGRQIGQLEVDLAALRTEWKDFKIEIIGSESAPFTDKFMQELLDKLGVVTLTNPEARLMFAEEMAERVIQKQHEEVRLKRQRNEDLPWARRGRILAWVAAALVATLTILNYSHQIWHVP